MLPALLEAAVARDVESLFFCRTATPGLENLELQNLPPGPKSG